MNPAPTLEQLHVAVNAGMVSRRAWGDLAIYNYTPECAYGRHWTPVTLAARGLVYHERSRQLMARPFDKFFNLGEMPETEPGVLPWSDAPVVTEKLDGSLGIVFHDGERWRVATRGSLESEQAVYAEANLLPRYDLTLIDRRLTVLTEIVYPGNRIVVDYGAREELVLLAARDRESGAEVVEPELADLARDAGLPLRRRFEFGGLDTLEYAANSEGFVLHWPGHALRVKLKSPEYVAAHRLLQYMAPRRVLEMITGGTLDDVRAQLPDWHRPQLDGIAGAILSRAGDLVSVAERLYAEHSHRLAESRKAFALSIADSAPAVKPLLFAMADGKDPLPVAYKAVGRDLPVAERTTEA